VTEEILELPRPTPALHAVVAKLDPRRVGFADYAHIENAADSFININDPGDMERAKRKIGELAEHPKNPDG
jgi:hypothetical protein